MINHKRLAMKVFYDVHEIPSRYMIPANVSIPLVNKVYDLVRQERKVEESIETIHSELLQVFGKFSLIDAGRMVYEIARKLGYEPSDFSLSSCRWMTSEEAKHRQEMKALSELRDYEDRRGFRTAYIRSR